jgi:hypothetical protein
MVVLSNLQCLALLINSTMLSSYWFSHRSGLDVGGSFWRVRFPGNILWCPGAKVYAGQSDKIDPQHNHFISRLKIYQSFLLI